MLRVVYVACNIQTSAGLLPPPPMLRPGLMYCGNKMSTSSSHRFEIPWTHLLDSDMSRVILPNSNKRKRSNPFPCFVLFSSARFLSVRLLGSCPGIVALLVCTTITSGPATSACRCEEGGGLGKRKRFSPTTTRETRFHPWRGSFPGRRAAEHGALQVGP
jgi:hypothetical protein